MKKLLKNKERINQINKEKKSKNKRKVKIKSSNNKKESKKEGSKENNKKKKKMTFEQRHKRLTTYVENDVYDKIQELKELREIRTITEFVNKAFKQELKKYD